jgi:hypothetical protein
MDSIAQAATKIYIFRVSRMDTNSSFWEMVSQKKKPIPNSSDKVIVFPCIGEDKY